MEKKYSGFRHRIHLLIAIVLLPFSGIAQPSRFLINSSFEVPAMGCAVPGYSILPESEIPGWVSSDTISRNKVSCSVLTSTKFKNVMELWQTGFGSVSSHSGRQHAEVNAYVNSGMYEVLCLLPNEVVTFSIWHRKRLDDANTENLVVQLIDPATNTIVGTASTSHNAVFGSWTLYSGTVTNNGVQGARRLGIFGRRYDRFGATGDLDQSYGNLIDDAVIDLKPLVDIRRFTVATVTEGSATAGSTKLELNVSGNIKTGTPGIVTITKTGTATYPADYTIGTPSRGSLTVNTNGDITLTLPPGDYDPSMDTGVNRGRITIPFTSIADGIPDNAETATYTITATSGGGGGVPALDLAYNIGGYSAGCNVRVGTAGFTLLDSTAILSGQLFNDADGLKDSLINGLGTNVDNTMRINVVNSAGNVVASKAIPATGIFTFSNLEVPDGTYTLRIGTAVTAIGAPAPPASLPSAAWVFTGEGLNPEGDGTINGNIPAVVLSGTSLVTNANFGIERLPLSDTVTAPSQRNPGGKLRITVPVLRGSDAEDLPPAGSSLLGKDLQINTLPVNGTLYYEGLAVTAGQVIRAYDPALLQCDPAAGAVTVRFNYSYRDEALRYSTVPGLVIMPFTAAASISGKVFDDANGVSGGVDGTAYTSGGLNALLVDSTGKVLAVTAVSTTDGSYTFPDLPDAAYKIMLSTSSPAIGTTAPSTSVLPAAYTNVSATDATPSDGITAVTVSSGTTVSNINFGIDRPPLAMAREKTIDAMPAIGTRFNLGDMPLSGSDAEDLPATGSWSARNVRITTLPSNGFVLRYNGVAITTAGTTITAYNPALLTIEASSATLEGTASSVFKYAVIDAAGLASAPETYKVNFTIALPLKLLSFQATGKDCGVYLEWQVAEEQDLDYYEPQKSTDGSHFAATGLIHPSASGAYTFMDHMPGSGMHYYRLRMVAYNKEISYSPVRKILCDCHTRELTVTPTLVDRELWVKGLSATDHIRITDLSGRTVYSATGKEGTTNLEVSGLQTGMYLVSVSDNAGANLVMVKIMKR